MASESEDLHLKIAKRIMEATEGYPVKVTQAGIWIALDPEGDAERYLAVLTRLLDAAFDLIDMLAFEIEDLRSRQRRSDDESSDPH